MINMSRAIVERMDNMKKQMGNVFKEVRTVSNNQNDMLESFEK